MGFSWLLSNKGVDMTKTQEGIITRYWGGENLIKLSSFLYGACVGSMGSASADDFEFLLEVNFTKRELELEG